MKWCVKERKKEKRRGLDEIKREYMFVYMKEENESESVVLLM
jgi:hypothetical protein